MKEDSSTEVVAFAPGRVNLIGEHTDYQGGFALPFAVQLGVTIRARPRADGQLRIASDHAGSAAEIRIGESPAAIEPAWARYPAAVVRMLGESGLRVPGFDARVESDLPVGAGLASSAALCVATALAALGCALEAGTAAPDLLPDRRTLAGLCRDAEGLAAGVRCGILDSYASLFGRAGRGLFLDCRSETHEEVPLDLVGVEFLAADTRTRRELTSSDYNRRREECEAAVGLIRDNGYEIESARDLRLEDVAAALLPLSEPHRFRIRHQVTERARTLSAKIALESGDADWLGTLMASSHASLLEDYEVSSGALEAMVDAARACPGVVGCRLTGAGFGGCVLVAVRREMAGAARACIREGYRERSGRDAEVLRLAPSDGAVLRGVPLP